MRASPAASACSLVSTTLTSNPASAKAMAMPEPMVPAPTIPTFWTERGSTASKPGRRVTSRSAKKACRRAADCSDERRARNVSRSRAMPSFSGRSAASRTSSAALPGASAPLALRRISAIFAEAFWLSMPAIVCSPVRRIGLPISSRASSIASWRRSPDESRSTRPRRRASAAFTMRPLETRSRAASRPMSLGKRCVPPAPGTSPSLTSGSPKLAPGSAMRAWQARAISQPPPSAVP